MIAVIDNNRGVYYDLRIAYFKEDVSMNRTLLFGIIAALVVIGAGTGVYEATRTANDVPILQTSSDSSGSQGTASDQQAIPTEEPVQTQQQITAKNCIADTCLQVPNLTYPVTGLNQTAKDALSKSLDNEYKLQAYYQAVINKFGNVRPFSMVIGAEAQHISVITSLDEKYGVTPVTNQWSAQSFPLGTFQNSCQTAASYEKDTVSMMNSLIPQVSSYPDITQVLSNIRDASQANHLPAFQQCSQ